MVEKRPEFSDEEQKKKSGRRLGAVEALEVYSGNHAETFEDLLEWPYRRFIKAFESWQKRDSLEKLEVKRNLHVSALYANTNLDDDKNTRGEYIDKITEWYNEVESEILKGPKAVEEEDEKIKEMEENDPFLAAGKRNLLPSKVNISEQ